MSDTTEKERKLRNDLRQLVSATQWLLDDLSDAGEDKNPETGATYDSVQQARDVLDTVRKNLEDSVDTGTPFDERVARLIEPGVEEAFQTVPELRTVVVIFDWLRDLNQGAAHGMWLNSGGSVKPQALAQQPESITGSLSQTAKMTATQLKLATNLGYSAEVSLQKLRKEKENAGTE